MQVRGIELAYDSIGSGPELIVFLHGVGADRTAWTSQLQYFAESGFTAVALDMRGSGDSQSRDQYGLVIPITISEFAADTHAFIQRLGFTRAHWIGNSMGGVIIQEALGAGYSTIDKVVLCNTFAHHPDSLAILPRPATALKSKSLETFAAERIPIALRPDTDPTALAAAIHAMARKDVEAYLAAWRETWSHDYRHLLPTIRNQKTLVITGSLDKITPPALGQEIASLIADSQYHQIYGAGHISNMDQTEEFNRVVLDFLKS